MEIIKPVILKKLDKRELLNDLSELEKSSPYYQFMNDYNKLDQYFITSTSKETVNSIIDFNVKLFQEHNGNIITLNDIYKLYDIRVSQRLLTNYIKAAIAPYLYNPKKGAKLYLKNRVEYIIEQHLSKYGLAFIKNNSL